MVYVPSSTGLLGLHDLKTSRGITLTHVDQMTVDGVFTWHTHLMHDLMVRGSIPMRLCPHQPHLHRYVVAIYKLPASDPLDSMLNCDPSH